MSTLHSHGTNRRYRVMPMRMIKLIICAKRCLIMGNPLVLMIGINMRACSCRVTFSATRRSRSRAGNGKTRRIAWRGLNHFLGHRLWLSWWEPWGIIKITRGWTEVLPVRRGTWPQRRRTCRDRSKSGTAKFI